MKANELINIPLGEKVYGIEVFHDNSTDLVAVGLKNSIVIYQISINENDPNADKIQTQVIQAVSYCGLMILNISFLLIQKFLRLIMILLFMQWHGHHQQDCLWLQGSIS